MNAQGRTADPRLVRAEWTRKPLASLADVGFEGKGHNLHFLGVLRLNATCLHSGIAVGGVIAQ